MPRAPVLAFVLLAVTALPGPARAAEGDAELTLLYRLALSAEMCGFPVSPRQAEAIGQAMDRRMAALALDDDAADAFYQEVEAAMAAEGWDRLCAKGGAWAKAYGAALRRYGR